MTEARGDLTAILNALKNRRVLCVGDVMLDRYVYGRAERISPEAPVPVIAQTHEVESPGAVGNVARNVAALGGEAFVVALIGDDEAALKITRMFASDRSLAADLITDPSRRTTVKTRIVAGAQQLMRIDEESDHAAVGRIAHELLEAALAELETSDALAISDYAKGALTHMVLKPLIEAAREAGKPVIVDPKGRDFLRYAGATVVKPNARELAIVSGKHIGGPADADAAAQDVMDACDLGAMIVTLSEKGMVLARRNAVPIVIPAQAREVFDVSGAGDTGLAAIALCLAAGADLEAAALIANAACGVAVTKAGASVVTGEETRRALQSARLSSLDQKILDADSLARVVARWREQGLKIGFTNGCFDLLHPGHVALLEQARGACDRLIVGLNADASVRRLKGSGRPVNGETARAIVLASLGHVDAVSLFDADTPAELIENLRPDVLVKGADYRETEVVGADFVKSYGGRVVLAELVEGYSTTAAIARIAR